MKIAVWLIPLGLAVTASTVAPAEPERPAARQENADASIAFANHGGVYSWRTEGDSTVYFEDQHRHWYRATLFAPAFDLPFVERIGIDSGPMGTLDRFGAVIVKGQRYPFRSFVAVDGPPVKKHAARK